MYNQIQIMRKLHSALIDKVALKYNLTECEIMILVFLRQNVGQDMATDIVNHLMISKAHVSGLVNNLETQGYISRVNDASDKKKIHIKITEKSKPIITEVRKEIRKMRANIYEGITKEEKDVIKTVLNKIKINVKDTYKIDLH